MTTAYEKDMHVILMTTLELAVPVWIMEMRKMSFYQRQAIARGCSDQIAAHGDALMYGGDGCGETFNALAKGIAALSFFPGGVTFHGRHWESRLRRHRRPVETDPHYQPNLFEKENGS